MMTSYNVHTEDIVVILHRLGNNKKVRTCSVQRQFLKCISDVWWFECRPWEYRQLYVNGVERQVTDLKVIFCILVIYIKPAKYHTQNI